MAEKKLSKKQLIKILKSDLHDCDLIISVLDAENCRLKNKLKTLKTASS